VTRFDISPRDKIELLGLDRDDKILYNLVVDLVCNLPLSKFKGDVSYRHQTDINSQGNYRKRNINLVVIIGVDDHDEKQEGEEVLKVIDTIDYEVPYTDGPLISIRIDFV
jgi:hypothetical protein